MNQSVLGRFKMTVHQQKLGVYGIKVENKKGESMSYRWRSDDLVCLHSGSKTFTAIGIGLCIDEGKCTLDQKILDFFPEYKACAAAGSEDITIRDLLHMASGKLEFWFAGSEEEIHSKDWAELFFKTPVTEKPGTSFYYSNGCTYMIGRIIEKISGENVKDFLTKRLFTPLDIWNPQWHTCPNGHTLAATGLYLTTDQYSRLGKLLLNKGIYEGKRIISESYIEKAICDRIGTKNYNQVDPEAASGYSYQLWKCSYEDAYRAEGMYGQFCIVIPSKEIVVTVTAHEEKNANDIVRAIFRDIVEPLSFESGDLVTLTNINTSDKV
ncbi:MAG: serine hydrolase [Cellulosilyticaceae bacterium]